MGIQCCYQCMNLPNCEGVTRLLYDARCFFTISSTVMYPGYFLYSFIQLCLNEMEVKLFFSSLLFHGGMCMNIHLI